ncbi:ABC transporter permease [Arcticibacter tournemirensis]
MFFIHYIKVAGRILFRNKLISGINLLSLSAGIAAVLLIALYIQSENQYDTFHAKGDRIFRAGFTFWEQGKVYDKGIPEFSPLFGPDAKAELSGIEDFCRMAGSGERYIGYGDRSFKTEGMHYADSSFFNLFSFRLLEGHTSSALKAPNTIVLDKTTAVKLFGDIQKAVGKTVLLNGKKDFLVTGVIEDAPSNTDIRYTALLSFSTLSSDPDSFMSWRGGYRYTTYLLLNKPENAAALETEFPAFMWRHINKSDASDGSKTEASLQPLKDIHLKYNYNSETLSRNLTIFSSVAILILIIACVNYINFSTAQSFTRIKEIGIRRVLGAGKNHLSFRWLTESAITTAMAFVIALILILSLTPVFTKLTGKELSIASQLFNGKLLLIAGIVFIVISAGAGAYLSFYLRKVTIRNTLTVTATSGKKGSTGKTLIVLQFIISIALITCTFIIYEQVSFIKSHPTGIDRENVLLVPLAGNNKQNDLTSRIKQDVLNLSLVKTASAVSEIPASGITMNGFLAEGQSQSMMIHQLDADEDLLKTFGLKLNSGDWFSKALRTKEDGYVINETLAKQLGWKNAVGKIIERDGPHRVVGVVKDFNFTSLHDRIEPLIITGKPWGGYQYLAVRYTSNPSLLIKQIKSIWESNSDLPFDYWFLDAEFDSMYKSEQQLTRLLIGFSVLSIVLSLSGVFGLVSLSIQKRIKEIGIRKVLGASVADIVRLTSAGFFVLIALASLIAIPLSAYLVNKWLQDFAYRIELQWWMFGLAGAVVLLVTLLTISARVIKAALTNPVEVLRNE